MKVTQTESVLSLKVKDVEHGSQNGYSCVYHTGHPILSVRDALGMTLRTTLNDEEVLIILD